MSDTRTPLEILRAHFAAHGRRKLTVRLGDQDLVFYVRPVTLRDKALLARYADSEDFCARVLVLKLEREDGTRAFGVGDIKPIVEAVPHDVLNGLAQRILEEGPGVEILGESCAGLPEGSCAASTVPPGWDEEPLPKYSPASPLPRLPRGSPKQMI